MAMTLVPAALPSSLDSSIIKVEGERLLLLRTEPVPSRSISPFFHYRPCTQVTFWSCLRICISMTALQKQRIRTLFVLLFLNILYSHSSYPSRPFIFAAAEEYVPIVLPPTSSILDSPDSPGLNPPPPPLHSDPHSVLPVASRIPSLYPPGSFDHSTRKAPVPSIPPKSHASNKPTYSPSSVQNPKEPQPATNSPPESSEPPTGNRAANALGLVHVPLKVSCEILRRFYNSTGGVSWSNQDGWQYVDSATDFVPGQGSNRRWFHAAQRARNWSKKRTLEKPLTRRSSGDNKRSRDRDNDHDNDHDDHGHDTEEGPDRRPPNHDAPSVDHVPSPRPQQPPSAASKKPEAPALLPSTADNHRPRPSGPDPNENYLPIGSDPSIGPATTPAMDLDPNNCCGWYGVVCIGPDGTLPPPWPPYDEDLIASRVGNPSGPPPSFSGPSSGKNVNPLGQSSPSSGAVAFVVGSLSAPVPAFGKRRADASPTRQKRFVPYYNYHDRNQQHHGKDGSRGGKNPGHQKAPVKGGANNQHLPDDGNNERGRPLDDPEEDEDEDEKHRHGPPPPLFSETPSREPIKKVDDPVYEDEDPLHTLPTPSQRPLIDDWYIIEL